MNELETAEVGGPDSAGEDYLLQQLKETVLRRQASMGRVRQAYEEDPRARRSATTAGLRAHISQPGMYGVGTPTYGPMFDAMDAQEKFLFENRVDPELLQLKEDDADPFTKLLSKVQSNKMAGRGMPYDVKISSPGVAVMYNKAVGSYTSIAVDDLNAFNKLYSMHYEQLMKVGGTTPRQAQATAYTMAHDDIQQGKKHRNIPDGPAVPGNMGRATPGASFGTPGTTSPGRPGIPNLSKEKSMRGAYSGNEDRDMSQDPYGPPTASGKGSIFGPPVGGNPTGDPRYGKLSDKKIASLDTTLGTSVPAQARPVPGTTVAQVRPAATSLDDFKYGPAESKSTNPLDRAPMTEEGKLFRAEEVKRDSDIIKGYSEGQKNYLSTIQTINNAEKNIEKTNQGPLWEVLNTIGGVANYFDPKGTLAEAAGNDAAYFGGMMDLVRSRIAALGAGTAVSNLDLIVTQKSVGDLSQTHNGRLKLLGQLRAATGTLKKIEDFQKGYFAQHGKLGGWEKAWETYYGDQPINKMQEVTYIPEGAKHNLTKYNVDNVDRYFEVFKKKYPDASHQDAVGSWKQYLATDHSKKVKK